MQNIVEFVKIESTPVSTKIQKVLNLVSSYFEEQLGMLAEKCKFDKKESKRQADFFNIVVYSKLADFVEKFLQQGTQICVLGRLQTRNYEDKNGVRRYVTEVIAEEINFADSFDKIKSDNTQEMVSEELKEKDTSQDFISNGDDLPF